jgi:hypothetical protein
MLSLLDWLRSHHRALTTRPVRRRRFRHRSYRPRCICPHLEALEDRLVLSSIIGLGIDAVYAINNNGVVAGEVQNSAKQEVSFLYNSNSKSATQFGGSGSSAEGINDSGLVVGEDGSGGGFVYNSTNQQTTPLGLVNIYDVGAGTIVGPQLGISPSGTVVANGEGSLFN